uniref:Uncharacterized protein n=1 Tax=Oryza nivara TaxID=4536 RepID=A0A0E0HL84_ORYNI
MDIIGGGAARAGCHHRHHRRPPPPRSAPPASRATTSPAFSAHRRFAGFASEHEHESPLPGVDSFLIQLWPADAAEVLASRLGIHPSLHTLNFVMRSAFHAAHPDLVFRLFSPDFLGDAATVAFLVRACSSEGRPLDGLRG